MKEKDKVVSNNSDKNTNHTITENGRKFYDADFRKNVVEVWNSGAYATVTDCARNYGINENTIYNWIRRSKSPSETNDPELITLKKELARTKMELEILKKAAIYFANHAR